MNVDRLERQARRTEAGGSLRPLLGRCDCSTRFARDMRANVRMDCRITRTQAEAYAAHLLESHPRNPSTEESL